MFVYEKRLQYPVRITKPNPKLASWIISQYGGPNGFLRRWPLPGKNNSGAAAFCGRAGWPDRDAPITCPPPDEKTGGPERDCSNRWS